MDNAWRQFTLAEWILNLEGRHAVEIQLGLTRVREVAERLGLLTFNCKVVTVAGTNGKGSTVAALEAIYKAAGYRTGSYTSPHLLHFNERIRVNSIPISDSFITRALVAVEDQRYPVNLTYFEMITLAALWHFKQCKLDLIILEAGLGGRLDATNILDANLAIITTIDFDHQEYLGHTLGAIGYEKAGILRAGQTFVYADTHPPETVVAEAEKLAVNMCCFDRDYFIDEQPNQWSLTFNSQEYMHLPKPPIQLKAAASAIIASEHLQPWLPVTKQNLHHAMQTVSIQGRLQYLPGKINLLFDVSHNPQASRLLAQQIKTLGIKGEVHGVFSALRDKDLSGIINPLKDCVHHWYPAQLNTARAADVRLILKTFDALGMIVHQCYDNPSRAFEAAQFRACEGDLIVIHGSFFTVAHVMGDQYQFEVQKEIV